MHAVDGGSRKRTWNADCAIASPVAGLRVVEAPRTVRGAGTEDHPMAMTKTKTFKKTRPLPRAKLRKSRTGPDTARGRADPKHRAARRDGLAPANAQRSPRKPKLTKKRICTDLLSRPEGASIEELQGATGWQPHSVRGFLAGTVKKASGLTLVSERPEIGPRRYRIVATGD